jgi:hypothetical protein
MTGPHEFTRRFLEKQMAHFQRGVDESKRDPSRAPGIQRYLDGKRAYFRHSIAACKFMLAQLRTYKPDPVPTLGHKPKR